MKIKEYEAKIDMTPRRCVRWIKPWGEEYAAFPEEYDAYSPEQEKELKIMTAFMESQVQAFLDEMRERTDFYIWAEAGKKGSDFEMLELALNNSRYSELVGLDTQRGSIRIDGSYTLYWG